MDAATSDNDTNGDACTTDAGVSDDAPSVDNSADTGVSYVAVENAI